MTAIDHAAGTDCSFERCMIFEAFQGMATPKRLQAIPGLFSSELASGKLHALSVKARAPKEPAGSAGLVQIQDL